MVSGEKSDLEALVDRFADLIERRAAIEEAWSGRDDTRGREIEADIAETRALILAVGNAGRRGPVLPVVVRRTVVDERGGGGGGQRT